MENINWKKIFFFENSRKSEYLDEEIFLNFLGKEKSQIIALIQSLKMENQNA
jgi:hypothetical protein